MNINKNKVTLIIDSLRGGGSQRVCVSIANGLIKSGWDVDLVVLNLNIVMMAIAYFLAKSFASGIRQVKCISLECGLQNGTLAVFVATEISNEIVYMIPTAAYALIMYITGFIFIWFLRKTT